MKILSCVCVLTVGCGIGIERAERPTLSFSNEETDPPTAGLAPPPTVKAGETSTLKMTVAWNGNNNTSLKFDLSAAPVAVDNAIGFPSGTQLEPASGVTLNFAPATVGHLATSIITISAVEGAVTGGYEICAQEQESGSETCQRFGVKVE